MEKSVCIKDKDGKNERRRGRAFGRVHKSFKAVNKQLRVSIDLIMAGCCGEYSAGSPCSPRF